MILLAFGIINILSWGGYFKVNWFPNTLNLSSLDAGATIINTLAMVVHKSKAIARSTI
jgi:hypothetical protein